MKLFNRFIRYMNPSIEPRVLKEMDRQSLRNLHIVSLIVLCLEAASVIPFLTSFSNGLDHHDMVSLANVSFCILLCAAASIISRKMLRNRDLPHRHFFIFKILFFILFFVWAIFSDYRHFKAGDQMLTFFTVNLVMVCFILFRPWIGTILLSCAYAGLYIFAYTFNGAAGIHPLNYPILALASIVSNAILYHAQIDICSKTIRLTENNEKLQNASRHDGLTGLQNRMALEADAEKMDGRRMTAYMIDINYFKEINDQYGHAAGDAILREVSETLKQLYPGAHYYRYGGDEFLVLTHKAPENNYGSDTYDFRKGPAHVLLSIGNAQGNPANYQELFALIAGADQALYVTKQRTHSAEFGGHDRRKNRQ